MEYRFIQHIRELRKVGYISDEEATPAAGALVDCALGTNPYGCPEAALEAVKNAALADIAAYPAYPYADLRRRIADFWRGFVDLPVGCVRMGGGSIGPLNQINKLFVGAGNRVLGYCPQFTDYIANVRSYGGRYEAYALPREKAYAFDCEAFLRRVEDGHALIYLDNPNNPTGQVIPLDQILEIARRARRLDACVIVDEAYGEYMPPSASAVTLTGACDNLFVVRSFSKGYGLAGLRAGYVVACERLMEYYQRIEIPFTITALAQAAVSAALGDGAFIERTLRNTAAVKAEVMRACRGLTCSATAPATSIMVLEHPDETVDLHAAFLRRGVLTEAGEGFPGLSRNAVRVRMPREAKPLADAVRGIENES
ncbi:MAG TPA: aminotransferase class I/II-fold pyridoxal phosphate-dependent enzyme [Clostridia bacterium]|nr:aminotransferase class I/II-fold pyridoxal phosphate-dependent enzyme [Clostridia bacterium]